MERLLCVVMGYAFGLIQTGYIYGKVKKIDIRQHGSGNAGTTNALRVMGIKAGIITLLGDCLKAVAACVIARVVIGGFCDIPDKLLALYAGLGAVLGHNFPFYLKFKGGKGIAATVGILFSIDWRIALISVALFLVTLAISHYVSMSSLVMMTSFFAVTIMFGIMGILFDGQDYMLIEAYVLTFVMAVMAFIRHKQNIVRLLNGNENKFSLKKKVEKTA
ncbi:MAG: glycerol-3-phosphate 1-O-acyltransferase PlsY [Lachnospiraceae bacterium]|nr:glycerol-3-phosphate 1-O-acyltransferase PlsY [Lachnospiraceae bacterium]